MNINSVRSNEILQAIYFGNLNSGVKGTSNTTGNISSRFSVDKVEISSFGQLLSKIESNLSAEDQTEVKDFFKEVRSAIKSGSFDAASLAASAPESLTSLAEENNINIEDVLNTLNEKANELKSRFGTPMMQGAPPNFASNGGQAPPPPPPGGMGGMDPMGQLMSQAESTSSSEEQTALEEYLEEVQAALDADNFDAASLAESVTDSLKSVAEANGVNLEDLLNSINEQADKLNMSGAAVMHGAFASPNSVSFGGQVPPPPPPPGMGRMDPMGQLLSQVESSLSSEDQTAVKSFLEEVKAAIDSGSFDAKALADSAPDSLKSLAEDNGINLEKLLTGLNERANEIKNRTSVEELNLSKEDMTKRNDFFKQVTEAINAGSFDAASLADNAPDALKSLAEESGINLKDFLNALNEKVNELKSKTSTTELNSISEDKTKIKEFFKQVADAIKGNNFDAKELADSAPDSLKQYLQARGIDLEDMLNTMYNNETETQAATGAATV